MRFFRLDDGEAEETSDKLLDSLENAFCARYDRRFTRETKFLFNPYLSPSISEYMQTEGNESSRFLSVPGMSRESVREIEGGGVPLYGLSSF